MTTAKQALEQLSSDPSARRLARDREVAVLMHGHLMASSFEAGKSEGLVEGRVEGRVDGLQFAVRMACKLLSIDLDAAKQQQLERMSVEQIERLIECLQNEHRWSDDI